MPHGPVGTRTGDEDHGLVEDPGAAWRDRRPPLLRDGPDLSDLRDLPVAAGYGAGSSGRPGGLPATVPMSDRHALVVLQARRRGFRLGFGATVGLCCGALALYLLAMNAGDRLDGPLAEALRSHGGQIQAALADWLRRVVAPALS